MVYPENLFEKLEFSQVLEVVRSYSLSSLGREYIDELYFQTDKNELESTLCCVQELLNILSSDHNYPQTHYYDLRKSINGLNKTGAFLEEHTFFELLKSLQTIRKIIELHKKLNESSPNLYQLSSSIIIYPSIIDLLKNVLSNEGKLKDHASDKLLEIRTNIREKEKSVSRTLEQVLSKAQKDGIVSEETNASFRDGRYVIPIHHSHKRKIKGFILDESASGQTFFVEPIEVYELNHAVRELLMEERKEVVKILAELSKEIKPYASEILNAFEFLKEIDGLLAKAKYAKQIGAIKPKINSTQGFKWNKARHPLLYIQFKETGKKLIPLDIELHQTERILLISGPNAGGKSVCLKTVGLLQLMFQSGFLVPVNDGSSFSIFEDIFLDIGDQQSLENDLSTYSSHLTNMKAVLKKASPKGLMLIDEFGTGTEPNIGGAIAESILEHLVQKGIYGVVNTHYGSLKHFASNREGIVNAAMLFDTHKLEPTYQLSIGKPGSSFAFEMARKMGIPEDVLELVQNKMGTDQIAFDKHLREITRDKRYWEQKRQNIKNKEKRLQEKIDRYEAKLAKADEKKQEIIRDSKKEYDLIVSQLNQKIEKVIREIKESNADKEKTKILRQSIQDDIKHKVQKFDQTSKIPPNKKDEEKASFQVGSKVKMEGQSGVGEILEIRNKSAMVSFGSLITQIKLHKLQKISNQEYDAQRTIGNPGRAKFNNRVFDFSGNIDLRGMRADQAINEVIQLIDDAIVAGIYDLRILHGKGDGILRSMIRDYLKTVDVVDKFQDEHIDQGGSGITVVKLNY